MGQDSKARGRDDFERAMAGVRRIPGTERVAEPAPRRMSVGRGDEVPSGGRGSGSRQSGIRIGSVAGLNRRQADRLRRGELAVEGALDLHGCTRSDAALRVAGFIGSSAARGLRCVLIVTGQGRADPLAAARGVLREGLEGWLNASGTREKVLACVPARRSDGGDGAFYVLLRR